MKVNNDAVKERVRAVALDLVSSSGAKGWTMDTVCRKSGLAKDTLYRMVSTKEELIKAALLGALEEHTRAMTAVLDSNGDLLTVMHNAVSLLSAFLERSSLERLGEVFLEYPSIERAVLAGMDGLYGTLEAFVERGKAAGLVRREVRTRLVVRILNAAVIDCIKRPEDDRAEDVWIALVTYLVDGIKA